MPAAVRVSLVVSLEATAFDAVAMRQGLGALEAVAALGYDGVELAVRDPQAVDGGWLRDRCAQLGLAVPALGTGQAYLRDGLALAHPEAGIRRAAMERMRHHVALARQLSALPGTPAAGVQVVVGLIRGPAGGDRQGAERRLTEALRPCLDAAAEAGVGLVIEAINRYESDWLHTLEEVAALVERVGHPRLGVLADTFHMNIEERSMDEALHAAAPYLRHVHVADSNRRAPGQGHLDFARLVGVLRAAGYDGFLSAEILPWPDPDEAGRLAIAHLRAVLGRP